MRLLLSHLLEEFFVMNLFVWVLHLQNMFRGESCSRKTRLDRHEAVSAEPSLTWVCLGRLRATPCRSRSWLDWLLRPAVPWVSWIWSRHYFFLIDLILLFQYFIYRVCFKSLVNGASLDSIDEFLDFGLLLHPFFLYLLFEELSVILCIPFTFQLFIIIVNFT